MAKRPLDALERAVSEARTQTELAKRISRYLKRKVEQGHVWNWLYRDRKAPPWAVIAIEKATGVSRHELRPDLYPLEEA